MVESTCTTGIFTALMRCNSVIYFVPYNSSTDLNIDVFVSMNATDGLAASFMVRVESNSNSDVNDFISFDLVVTTSPPPEFTENEVCL